MHTRARKRTLFALFLFLVVLIVLPAWFTWRVVRQERLNRDLIAAIKQDDTATAIALLNAGAYANAEERDDKPVSARQVLMDWWNRLRGPKTTAGSSYHPSALIVASQIYERDLPPPENVALFQALLAHGADPNARDKYGNTALIYAAGNGYPATARLLLDRGAEVKASNIDGNTALIVATACEGTDVVRLLLDRGAAVNAVGKDGQTALMSAAAEGYKDTVRFLLNRGADYGVKDRYGATALSWAEECGHKDCVRLLKQHGAKE